MTTTETGIKEAMAMAQAYTHLVMAKSNVDNARMRLRYTDIEDVEEDLWGVYEVLDR